MPGESGRRRRRSESFGRSQKSLGGLGGGLGQYGNCVCAGSGTCNIWDGLVHWTLALTVHVRIPKSFCAGLCISSPRFTVCVRCLS